MKISILTAIILALAASVSGCATPAAGDAADEDLQAEAPGPQPREASIADVHESNRSEIRECFEQSAAAGADEAHVVEVEMHLPRTGTPASIRLLDPETVPGGLRACLEEALADFEYGEAEHGATYYQELNYDAQRAELSFSEPIDAYHRWGLTEEEIEGVVAQHEPQIDECYAEAEERPEGRVLITLAIGSQGQLARAGIKKSTLDSPIVEDCLVEQAFEMEFPPPRGGGVVVYDVPFRFQADGAWVK